MPGWPSLNRATTLIRRNATTDLIAAGPGRCSASLSLPGSQESRCSQKSGESHSTWRQSTDPPFWSGRPIEDMDDELRDWIIDFGDSGCVARYRMGPQYITILAVRHQKEVGF